MVVSPRTDPAHVDLSPPNMGPVVAGSVKESRDQVPSRCYI
jgi:hypothetical protein